LADIAAMQGAGSIGGAAVGSLPVAEMPCGSSDNSAAARKALLNETNRDMGWL
jgi:hypothetical protein